jgi:hypothetical protein
MVTIPHYTCAACGHEWIPRAQQPPKICPKCKSDDWDKYEDAVVYFAQKGEDGPIKIGITTSVYSRMNLLRTHSESPIAILAVVAGGREKEIEISKQFATEKMNGEWYLPSEKLLKYISLLDNKIIVEPRNRGRPKLHGDAISFRLPLKDDARFRAEAAHRGITTGDLAREIALADCKKD